MITGGNYDIDVEVIGVNGQQLHKDSRKQYDSYTWTTEVTGEYKFCFSNEFSTFTHKTVYFDFQVGDEKPLHGDGKMEMPMTQVTCRQSHVKIFVGRFKKICSISKYYNL